MKDCIFCKIARDEVPSRKAHHEEGVIVSFPDIDQRVAGHTLVIPVEHYRWFDEVPDEVADKLFRAARHVSRQLREEIGADYIQLSIIGTDVPHVHVHLLPRFLKDKPPTP